MDGTQPQGSKGEGGLLGGSEKGEDSQEGVYRADRSLKKQSSSPQAHGLFPENISGTPSLETLSVCG